MNSIRTFLGLFYLLLMVLLPWVHMPTHAYEAEAASCASGCGHHEAPADDSDEHDDCGLCSLAIAYTELPKVFSAPEALFMPMDVPAFSAAQPELTIQRTHPARAPPIMTI